MDRAENWKPIDGWPAYEVSDLGRVRSVGRNVRGRWGLYWKPGRILAQSGSTYRHVRLYSDGDAIDMDVHTLVLRTFTGPREPGTVARHGPGGKLDNRWPENLSWGTQSDNLTVDRDRDGTTVNGERVYGAKLTPADVIECRARRKAGEPVAALAREFGVCRSAMYRATDGDTWHHL